MDDDDEAGFTHRTAEGVAVSLRRENRREAINEILPPWSLAGAEEAAAFDLAWSGVQTLKRQLSELIVIWPDRAARFELDFNACLADVAKELAEKIKGIG